MVNTEIEDLEDEPFEAPSVFSMSGDDVKSVRVSKNETIAVEQDHKTEFGYFLVDTQKGYLVTVIGKHLPIFKDSNKYQDWKVHVNVILPRLFDILDEEHISYIDALADAIILDIEDMKKDESIFFFQYQNQPVIIVSQKIITEIPNTKVEGFKSIRYRWNAYVGKWPPLRFIQDNLNSFEDYLPEFNFPPKSKDATQYGYRVFAIRNNLIATLHIVEEHKINPNIKNPGVHFFWNTIPTEFISKYPDIFEN
ncbi:hypothetical protein KC678_01690 [Candidatus Dojkabacteria bacterium]|uniref:Uncharacterized protein n=1 Tax=Candidatus Dojkabacteria bacterium TaxID=2099670 RepID=A0A955IB23_9BACT|nr:hypothetical protein [Candidatus Dojkabacteria bacterium]